jgi:hypothetical protein
VTPTSITRRVLSSTMKNAKSDRKKRSVTGKRVTGPDICRMMVQKGRPPPSPWLGRANSSDVLLNGPLAHMKTQFQQFANNFRLRKNHPRVNIWSIVVDMIIPIVILVYFLADACVRCILHVMALGNPFY